MVETGQISFRCSHHLCEMHHDPADETYRKPRQLRNTPLLKYIRLSSLFITLCYAGALYIAFKKHCCDPELLNELQSNEDQQAMMQDYATTPFLRNTIEKLFERQQVKSKEEAEPKDTQANV